mgnify:FL=1
MTVIVNIWLGEIPQFTVWNGIRGKDVGHASTLVIDDENSEDTIYISHRPQTTDSENSKTKFNNKDTSKHYALEKHFTVKAEPISFDEDCKRRGKKPGQVRKPDNQITISGLNEYRIREIYQKYLSNELPESESQYHVRKNNCSTVVAYFIRQGLECPEKVSKSCMLCMLPTNQPNWRIRTGIMSCLLLMYPLYIYFGFGNILLYALLFIIIYTAFLLFSLFNIEHLLIGTNFAKRFWSPRSIEHFAKKVRREICKNPSNLCFMRKRKK